MNFRSLAAGEVVLAVLAQLFAPTTARADAEDEDEHEGEEATGRREAPASRFEMWFGGTKFAPSLRDALLGRAHVPRQRSCVGRPDRP